MSSRARVGAERRRVMRPDMLDYRNAFRAGFRHGEDVGACSPREAESVLRSYGRPVDSKSIDIFCNGADDGARGDQFRYLLSYAVQS